MMHAFSTISTELGSSVSTAIFLLFALGGLFMIVSGLLSLVEASTVGRNGTVAGAWGKIILGVLLFLLTSFLKMTSKTLFGSAINVGSLGSQASDTGNGTTTCVASSTGASSSLTACSLQNLKAAVPSAIHLAMVIAFVAGVIIVGSALWEMAHQWNEQRNNRRVSWGKIIGGTLLCNVAWAISVIETTFGISGAVITTTGFSASSTLLAYVPPSATIASQLGGNITGMMQSILNILAFFGVVAFIRGIFVLIAATDIQAGKDTSIGKAACFMGAGTFLINMGWFVPAVGTMLFGSGNKIL